MFVGISAVRLVPHRTVPNRCDEILTPINRVSHDQYSSSTEAHRRSNGPSAPPVGVAGECACNGIRERAGRHASQASDRGSRCFVALSATAIGCTAQASDRTEDVLAGGAGVNEPAIGAQVVMALQCSHDEDHARRNQLGEALLFLTRAEVAELRDAAEAVLTHFDEPGYHAHVSSADYQIELTLAPEVESA